MSVPSRIKKLEDAALATAAAGSDTCPHCGTWNPCGVYLSIDNEGDDHVVPRCMTCGGPRGDRSPKGLHVYHRWMIEAI